MVVAVLARAVALLNPTIRPHLVLRAALALMAVAAGLAAWSPARALVPLPVAVKAPAAPPEAF